jgi:hypothetical protein
MKRIACFLLLLAFAAGVVCEAATAPGDSASKTEMKAAAEATATLVFYRPKRFYGSGLTPSVYVNGEQVARLDNGRFFVLSVKPGTLKIASSMKHDPLEIQAKAGKTEFMEMAIMTGTWKGGGRLIPTAAADAKEAIKKLKPLDKKWVQSDQVSFDLPGEASAGTN